MLEEYDYKGISDALINELRIEGSRSESLQREVRGLTGFKAKLTRALIRYVSQYHPLPWIFIPGYDPEDSRANAGEGLHGPRVVASDGAVVAMIDHIVGEQLVDLTRRPFVLTGQEKTYLARIAGLVSLHQRAYEGELMDEISLTSAADVAP